MKIKDVEAIFPLSPVQEEMLLNASSNGSATTNCSQVVFSLRGDLDVSRFERAWQEQINLHSILRSSFAWKRIKQPVQLINKSLNFALPEVDWRELPDFEQQDRLEDFLVSDRERGFDPSVPPLIRVTLFRTHDNLWALVLSYHSILFDAQSLPSILRNVFTAYDGMNNGGVARLAAIRPHKDYVSWMKEQKPSESKAYWQRLFENFDTPNQISLADPESDGPRHQERFDKCARELSSVGISDLNAWARKNGLRVQTVIEAAWSILLSRYSGQRDVVFGLTLSGRPDSLRGDGALVGAFTNTVPLRLLIKPDADALSFLQQVERLHHDAQHFEYTSRSRILEWTNLDAGIPLFDTCLNFDNHIVDQCASIQSKSLALQNFRLIEKAPSPLSINVNLGSSLIVEAVYSTKKYDLEMISQMLRHLEYLIASIMDHPERVLWAVEMMSEEERRVLLEEWNETAVEYPRERSVAELFEETVLNHPQSIAVEYEGEQLSYEQLNRRANQLAHYLKGKGVGPEVAVGIMLDRSLELVVGLVAILKAGGAYLPLDPQYPQQRLSFMLADSQASTVLTQRKYAEVLPESTAELVLIDQDSEQIAAQSEQDLAPAASGSNLAYIIYTSGSTGQPKGVSVEQRAVTRLVRGANYVELGHEEVLLQYAPVSFDASTFEVWGALLNGARLVVMRAGEVTLRELGHTLTEQAVTTLWLTSALFHQMVDEEASSLAGVRQLIAGGDVLSPGHVNKVLQVQRQGTVINGYGPTENTTFSTCAVMRGQLEAGRGVPIGLPISNSTAYVLNEWLEPVPVGVTGELYVGGEGLARGYAGRAEQTAERFVPHPYAKQAGERLYRTGDEVRRRRDGKLEFIGRTDQQVKVRGFRIELAEIERVLAQHEVVEEAAVVMRQSRTGDKRLVGYVVLRAALEDVNRELREHVRSALPEYMVPAAVMVLERLPVTANGKLDRAALPELEEGKEEKALLGPRTVEEELLLEMWKQVLGVEQISIDDDFFELGGHSLLATQVIARIRHVFQVEIGLRVLFEEPTIVGLSSAIRTQLQQGQAGVKPELKQAERGAVVELSYAQQRLWFNEQMGAGSTSYNVPVGVRLRGELNVSALARALQEVVRRHEVLRTRIEVIETQPYQVIDEEVELRLPVIDHSELAEQAAAGERMKREEANERFNLSTGPVIRAKLIRQGPLDHLLLVTMHHIVSDGWSMGVLVKEVSALYEAYRRGAESPLAELPVQYADYALWQREWLQGEVLEEQLKYWEERLAGAPLQLELPTDRARGAMRAGGGRAAQLRVEFDEELTKSVKEESRKQALTTYMLLMGMVGVLLTRYSRSGEVVIGSPIANRMVAEVEGLIGFFVNTLALRVRVDEEETVEELLKRVREEVLGAYAHQDVPYEKVVERVQVERAGEAGGLFQVMVAMQNAPSSEIRMEGLEIEAESVGNERAKFELTLGLGEEGGRLVGGVEYNEELWDAESVQRMMGHLEELLRGVVGGGSGKRVRELGMMSAAERRQVLEEWNETAVEYPRERSVAELFEETVLNHPQSTAVEYEGEQLSYEQLNRRANQLAHYLRSRGVGPEVAVGIMLDRSLEMIVGLVAILKAGGAYVPLDPQYPQQRLSFMLADSQASTVITDSKYAQVLPESTAQLVLIDQDSEQIAAQSEQDLAPAASGSNLAYIIYTSGSTGQPKGVSVEQRAVSRLVRGANYVELGHEEVLLQYAPVSFDASTFEVWGALLNGARLVVMRAGEVTLRELGHTLTEQAVTTLWLTSALFHQMVDEEVSSLAGVRQLIAGGDVLSPGHVNKVLQVQRQGTVINGYGPTENTTFSTCAVMRGQLEAGRGVPIGLPISNSTAYVLNERLEPVPVGVTGELYVGGEGLARGYAGRAEQTAERFVPHPYAKQAGERLYRTGDEVRRRRDGKLEFIGRRDQQVKVRGFRIELAEIERVLAQHEAVEEAAVVMRQSRTGDKRLVGYVVLSAALEDVNRELREHVRGALPEYMVPAAVMVLERLPVTANGKLDRAALPELDEGQVGAAGYEPPRTPVEEVLAGIWAELLNLERVSIHDDFFDLGGHSLLVMRLNAWTRDAFGVEVTVGELFASPTLTAMAAIVEQRLRSGQGLQMPALERVASREMAPLSYAQQRLWFLQNLYPEDTSYNMPFGLKLKGQLDIGALNKAFSEIVRRHETLRTRFVAAAGGAIQVVQPAREWRLPLVDLSGLGESQQQAETKTLRRREAGRRFDLARDESLHTVLLRRSAEDHLLLVTMHHIVSDGWSMGVLVKEVSALYEAYRRGAESPLAELPVQYADYAVWQREWLQGEVLEEQLRYWEEKLAGAPLQLELPTDRARGAMRAGGGRAAQLRVEFDEELTRGVKEESRKQALTTYMLLMGVVGVLLTRYSRSSEVVIGSPIANRVVVEVEGLIGFFVNTLALRVRVDEEETVEELLKRVREEVLGAYAHQDVPYEKVVERVQVERAGEVGGLFQVMVAMQNAPSSEMRMEGLEIEAESVGNERAKFELMIGLGEAGGRLVGGVEYSEELWDEESVLRMMRHLEELLRGVVAGGGRRVRELGMMSAAERRQVLEEWNETAVEYPRERSMAELFEEVAVSHPQSIAVAYEGEQLSYEELNRRANQLAHYLRSRGVGPEVAVGIMLDRSLEMIVGLVAILKAGGAYVPLDPKYPQQRLSFMLADSQATTVITDSKYAQVLPESTAQLVLIDKDSEQIAAESEQDLPAAASGSNLAYIIYTSGSTGQPKGVAIEHHNAVAFINWSRREFTDREMSAVLASTSICFDLSVFEIFATLSRGGKVVVVKDVLELVRGKVEAVSLINTVPSAMRQLLELKAVPEGVEVVNLAGEVLSRKLVEEVYAAGAVKRVLNLYGPTEDTTYSTGEEVSREATEVMIGAVLENKRLYVLDERLEAVAIGVRGEIYLGGEGQARGYVGRAEQTAARFLPDPFSRKGGERLYRTGDEGRLRAGGRVEYLGRRDEQVKVRGYRIELGEIEATLSRHPGIAECVIVLKEKKQGAPQIAAYFVAKAGQVLNLTELKSFLKVRLPGYMIPAAFVSMEEMPRTPNGKIDRRSLPEPVGWTEPVGLDDGVPRSPIEEMLVQIWKEVLEVEDVRINDNFFDIGGHSLLVMRLNASIRDAFGVEVTVGELFESARLTAMAAIVEQRLRSGQSLQMPALERVASHEKAPLSYAQQRLWFLQNLHPEDTSYNMSFGLKLKGQLDIGALNQAFSEIVRRHEMLRTRFVGADGGAIQVVQPARAWRLPLVDLSGLGESQQQAETKALTRREAGRRFDLARDESLHTVLLRRSAEDHLLLVTMHHIVSDGSSMGVLVKEVSVLYEAYRRGAESPLAELPVQYADYALWQREWMQGEVLEEQLRYWEEKLAGAPLQLELPTDRARGAMRAGGGRARQLRVEFDEELNRSVKQESRKQALTTYMLLMGVVGVLLTRYSRSSEVVIGSPIANRMMAEVEGLIGFFVNTLALRVRVEEEETVEELLRRVREEVLGAYAHQDVPYEKVVERVQVERAGEAGELFQVMVTVQNAPRSEIRLEGLEIETESVRNERAKFELMIGLGEVGGRLVGGVEYNEELWDQASVLRMMRHLEELLRGVVAGGGKRVRELEMMSAAERRQVLEEWNETAVEYPRESSVAELFEEVVVQHGQAVAVEYEGEQLSYEQLNRRANQLAHYLKGKGVGPEVAVGIMLDRSLELIVGLVAILKAGGAYVPLDPQYPKQRLTFMLKDSKASTVLTDSKYAQVLPGSTAQLVVIDKDSERIAAESEQDLAPSASGSNLAYITYTSGSTGQPKGVSVEQRAVTRLVRGANYVELGPEEVLLQFGPVSFDASTFEVWGALLNGARLVVMRAGEVTLRELGRTLTQHAVTTIFLTSALFHQMVDEEAESLAVVKQVITGGDVLSPTHIDKALAHQHEGTVISAYGPTENTTFSTCEVMSGKRPEGRRVPLGLPISNSTAYVLNEWLEPVPVGVTAELYVGGEGLARCYAGRAEQTAERFVPHPYAKQPGERLYRTGDEVRRRRDGKLEFIGRTDQQVKVRGFRIELAEIERVLAQHEVVEEAVVVMRPSRTGDKRLVAYVVLSAELEDVNRELREHVRRELPEYMVPAAVMVLERLPVTANGKLDRAALPELEEGKEDKALVGPRTVEEELLLDMWKQVLGVEQISIDDDFFELGGHSLLATQVIARIRHVFQVEIGLQVLFAEPTIAGLSDAVRAQLQQGQVVVKPELKRAERGAVVELSYAQQRLWFNEQMGAGSTSYNVPVGVRLRGELNVSALARTLQEVVRRHEVLRTRIELMGTQPYQVIDEEVELRLPVIDLSELDQQSQAVVSERVKREEASAGFNLSTGPVIRAKLIRQGAQDHLLLVTMHHIVSDGWSMGVLVKEVSALYEAYRRGAESPLAELPVQYADYAVWQREWLQGEVLEEQLRYWEERLAGAPVQLELPTDRARGAMRAGGGRARQLRVEFDEELTRGVKEESRKQALTTYMLLMGVVGVLLTRYSRSSEVVIGSPIANRVVAEVEGLIGFFVNTLALRVRVDEEETVEELLKRVREEVLGAYAHQDVPYEKVVERVQVERAGEAGGLFQVMVAMQNAPSSEMRMEGLEIETESVGNERAKFELMIGLGEAGGRLVGGVEYREELWDEESVLRMMRHLEELLRGVVAGGGKRVRELGMMSAAERRQVLEEWNETAVEYPRERSMAELFEEVAVSHAQAIAVAYEGEQLSYEQLNRRANQLAHYLRSKGVGPEVAVGIMLDRSLEMIVGLVAILKAGGAYVPLDPKYPQQRLSFMLADSGASLVITQSKYAAHLSEQRLDMVLIDEHSERIAAESEQDLPPAASGSNLAYIIYTSGSTGQPKGVAIEHHNAVAFINWSRREFTDREMSAVLASTSICFDLSVFEIFATLSRGGKVVVVKDVLELVRGKVEAVSLINTVPSAMRQLLELKAVPEGVEVVNLAGEVLGRKLVEEVYAAGAVRRVLNLYGPTEDTTYSTGEEVSREATEVMIGAVLENKRLYVLDERLEAVAIGVRGEIYLGGEGQARGYVGRAEQTAERFVPDPFSRKGGERLYRTGDEGRMRAGGRVEYLGRRDEQVKVRGYRIELGEIEATLSRHPGIAECVIVLKEKKQGAPQIAAYFVAKAGQVLNLTELKSFLKVGLPGYMIPAAFVSMEEMPRTPNGKIDRAALPELEEGLGTTEYEPPRTPVEEVLAGIWAELLNMESVSIHDDFFDLGGHSLLAMRLNAWIRDALGVEVTVGELFQSPTLTAMAAIVEQQLRSGQDLQRPALERVASREKAPLSYAQQRLWFLQNLHPEDTSYNMPFGLKLKGQLDIDALNKVFSEIVRRHETLRTRFVAAGGGAIQVVQPAREWQLPLVDLSGLGESQQQAETTALTRREAARRFDLARDESLHTVLLRRSAEDHLLLVTMHHIVSDWWSMGVLVKEVSVLYEAYRRGAESPLAELPVQYADYARWQREWLQGELLEEQLRYWEEKLAGAPLQVELPSDRGRGAMRAGGGRAAQLRVEFDEELTRAVKEESRKQALTTYMLLMGVVGVLLTRYSRSSEVVIGSPIANRMVAEVEGLIGFFVNTLALRVRVEEEETVEELLRRVREEVLGAYAHQDVPYEKVVERMQVERAGDAGGLFQVMVAMQNTPRSEIRMEGLEIEAESVGNERVKFELTIGLGEEGGRLVGGVEYNEELWDEASVRRMMGHLEELLRGVVEGGGKRVRELELMSAAERRQIIEGWNEAEREYAPALTLSELFEAQCARTPAAVALVFDDTTLSYRELNERANQLAHYLRRGGVGPDVLVGILMDRSVEMVVAVLGILKAGGAYVPLDPAYPTERLAFMVQDSGMRVLLTRERLNEVPDEYAGTTLSLTEQWDAIAGESPENLASGAQPENLAYVIYTSGSTGRPKGVLVTHENVARLLEATQVHFEFKESDVWTLFHSYAFDFSVWEIWGALGYGGKLVIVPYWISRSAEAFHRLLVSEQVTVLNQTPSAFRQLMAADEAAGADVELQLRLVIFGGEALELQSLQPWFARHGDHIPRLVNMFGITETTVHVTYRPLTAADLELAASSVIGVPISDLQVYLLDRHLSPVPVGVVGEIHVGGLGVARGYLRQPALTAERFIPHPFSQKPGTRLYKSGDLGRYLANGEIEYVGRLDHQVKIRGFRVELGEIEKTLEQFPGVAQATVVAREYATGDRRLIAYLVPDQKSALPVAQWQHLQATGQLDGEQLIGSVREHLREKLPEYMVPSHLVLLNSLPLTPNGKIDRDSLPDPAVWTEQVGLDDGTPRSPIEEMLVQIWKEVLGSSRVDLQACKLEYSIVSPK